jgi:hypothetical protein
LCPQNLEGKNRCFEKIKGSIFSFRFLGSIIKAKSVFQGIVASHTNIKTDELKTLKENPLINERRCYLAMLINFKNLGLCIKKASMSLKKLRGYQSITPTQKVATTEKEIFIWHAIPDSNHAALDQNLVTERRKHASLFLTTPLVLLSASNGCTRSCFCASVLPRPSCFKKTTSPLSLNLCPE